VDVDGLDLSRIADDHGEIGATSALLNRFALELLQPPSGMTNPPERHQAGRFRWIGGPTQRFFIGRTFKI
jgi:hypothetical protein